MYLLPTSMELLVTLSSIFLIIHFINVINSQLFTNFHLNEIRPCGSSKGIMQIHYINFTEKDGQQYLNLDFETAIPLDENVGAICFITYAVDGKTYLPLFTIREKNMCKAANKYVGEFWYDVQRAAQITPGLCPVPAKHYHIHNMLMDFRKITLQTFPFGKLRFIVKFTDNRNSSNMLLCYLMELDNIVN